MSVLLRNFGDHNIMAAINFKVYHFEHFNTQNTFWSDTVSECPMHTILFNNHSYADLEDYESNPINLTFDETMNQSCFEVIILDDDSYELREDFFVNISTSDPEADIRPTTTIMMILDEDSEEKLSDIDPGESIMIIHQGCSQCFPFGFTPIILMTTPTVCWVGTILQ